MSDWLKDTINRADQHTADQQSTQEQAIQIAISTLEQHRESIAQQERYYMDEMSPYVTAIEDLNNSLRDARFSVDGPKYRYGTHRPTDYREPITDPITYGEYSSGSSWEDSGCFFRSGVCVTYYYNLTRSYSESTQISLYPKLTNPIDLESARNKAVLIPKIIMSSPCPPHCLACEFNDSSEAISQDQGEYLWKNGEVFIGPRNWPLRWIVDDDFVGMVYFPEMEPVTYFCDVIGFPNIDLSYYKGRIDEFREIIQSILSMWIYYKKTGVIDENSKIRISEEIEKRNRQKPVVHIRNTDSKTTSNRRKRFGLF